MIAHQKPTILSSRIMHPESRLEVEISELCQELCRRKIEMSLRAQSRNDTQAADTFFAKRHVSQTLDEVRGSRAEAGLPVRASAALEALASSRHHGTAVSSSASAAGAAVPPRRDRLFDGTP